MKYFNKFRDSDSSTIFISNLIIAILNFSITIFLTRILGQNEFGNYIIISSFILLLQVLFGLRTGEAVLRFIKKETRIDDKNAIIKQLLIIDFLVNSILYVFIIIIGYFYALNQSIEYSYILIFGSIVFVNIGLSIFENIYIINNEIVKMHKIKLVATILIFILTLTFGYIWQLKGVLIGMVLGNLLKNMIHFYYIRSELFNNRTFFSKSNFLKLNEYILFFKHTYISTSFKAGSQGLDIFLLSLVFGNEKIALYEVGKKFAQIPGLFIGSIWTAKSKLIIEYAQIGNDKKLYAMIKRTYKIIIPLGLLLGFVFLLVGKDIIGLIFGNTYLESFQIAFVFFIFFWFGNLFGGYGRLYLIAINKANILTFMNGLTFFNVLIIGYITRHNLMYMALTICLTIMFNALYLNYYILKRIEKSEP